MDKSKLWTKDFLTGTFINFFLMLNYYLLVVIMAIYAMDTFGSSPSEAGLASSIFVIGAIVTRMLCGRWIEHVGRKKMLITGTVACLGMTLFYLVVNNIGFLLVIRFLHGVAYGVASIAIGTIVTSIVPQDRRGEGIGYYMLSLTLASAIGPFLGMFILQHGSFRLIFLGCIISAVLSFINVFLLSVPEVKLTNEQLVGMKRFKWSDFFESKAIPICIVCAVIYFCYSSILSFLTPYAKELDLVDAASFFFVVYSFAILISRPFTGRLFDSKGENIIMYPAFLTFMIGMAILSQAHHGITLLVAGALLGFGVGVVQSCGLAIAVKVTPVQRLGLANSTFYIFLDVGVGIGPVILGVFIPLIGYRGIYIAMMIIALICTFLYHLLHGKSVQEGKVEMNSLNV